MISPLENGRIALTSLNANRIRSALTVLGVVIGVTAVVVIFAVGTGAREKISRDLTSLGTNVLFVRPTYRRSGGARSSSVRTLTVKDGQAIAEGCAGVVAVAPLASTGAQVVRGNLNWATQVTGTTGAYLTVKDWSVSSGRPFAATEERNGAKVCLLGATVVEKLFPAGESPLGQTIRVGSAPFRVIGTLTKKGEAMFGDEDDVVLAPFATVRRRLAPTRNPNRVQAIMVKSSSPEDLDRAQREAEALLRRRHRLRPDQESDFTVDNFAQILKATNSATAVMTLLLTAVASVSLLVGGIGIMNIMLVSVTERTREIGIRMALGATAADIRVQFLIEALVLSLLGGLTGIALGLGGARLVTITTGWRTSVPLYALGLAVGVAAATGVFFGLYPAVKASRLNPIDALRHE